MPVFMDSLLKASDKYWTSHAVFVDLAKAFDRVFHSPLLQNPQSCGVVDLVLRGFRAGRPSKETIDAAFIEPAPVTAGVPQGSVMVLLPYLLHTSDISRALLVSIVLHADNAIFRIPNLYLFSSANGEGKRRSEDRIAPI